MQSDEYSGILPRKDSKLRGLSQCLCLLHDLEDNHLSMVYIYVCLFFVFLRKGP